MKNGAEMTAALGDHGRLMDGIYHRQRLIYDATRKYYLLGRDALHRAGLEDRARVTPGDATAFDTEAAFGTADFDRVFISYSLSMIPDWRLALQQAASVLAPGGQLHVVDFGQQERLPRWFRSTLHVWLAKFHVTPRGDLEGAMREIAGRIGGTLEFASPYRDYARLGVIRAPAGCWPSLPAAT